jgi:sRNA-binding protein
VHAAGAELGDVMDVAGPGSDGVEHCEINTADIAQNQSQSQAPDRQAQREAALQTLAALAELYPACFVADKSKPHRPLKRGIHRDLIDRGILRPNECRLVFLLYVTRRQYQKALAASGPRVDLDGNVDGEVTAEEIENARRVMVRINAQMRERQRAAREQGAPEAPPSEAPRRLGLSDLKRAAVERRNGGAS